MDNIEHLKAIVANCEAEGKRGYDHLAHSIANIVNSLRDDAEKLKEFCIRIADETFNPEDAPDATKQTQDANRPQGQGQAGQRDQAAVAGQNYEAGQRR